MSNTQVARARSQPRPSPSDRALWVALTSPPWIARFVAAVGAMTFASALSPALRGRVHIVTGLVPDFVPSAATTGAPATGTILLPGDLPRIGTAALRAEAFLVAPAWVQRIVARR